VSVPQGPVPGGVERVEELAACAAIEGLDAVEGRELALAPRGARRRAEFEAAAAALHLAFLAERAGRTNKAVPSRALQPSAGFQARLLAQALEMFSQPRATSRADEPELQAAQRARPELVGGGPRPARSMTALHRSGWLLAAAGLGLSAWLGTELVAERAGRESVDPAARRARLIASAPDHTALPWTPLGHGAKEGLDGGLVWSDSRNAGFMTFVGLAPNDPEVAQYQLWIFRGADLASEPYPVDGGVFDVNADGEVIVPIDAKLDVGHGTTFVVTLEPHGGVVVSDRSRLVALAQRPG